MHQTAKINFGKFNETYLKYFKNPKVLELGSEDTNGSLKNLITSDVSYIGTDLSSGNNVDVVLKDPYKFSFDDNSFDIVITSSTFEHIDFFWLTFLEILRVLKPRGLFYLNVPSNGPFHRHPTDNWRFYPDSGKVLKKWANKNNYNTEVLESYIGEQGDGETWNDYVCIMLKDEEYLNDFNLRILDNLKKFRNGKTNKSKVFINFNKNTQDQDNWGWFLYYKLRKFIKKIHISNKFD